MKTRSFTDLRGAICSFTKEDEDYITVRHVLKRGEKIGLHHHKIANEWLVIDSGRFIVQMGEDRQEFKVEKGVLVINLPPMQLHSFEAKSKMSYLVYRDKKDKTIYGRKKNQN